MNKIADTAKIYPGVHLGKDVIIEDFCLIGAPSLEEGEQVETFIGDNAHIRSHTVIYHGCSIGKNFKTGNKANIREFCQIGNDVSIGTLSVLEHSVILKDEVRLHSQAFIPEFSILEKRVWIGANVVLTNSKYPNLPETKTYLKGPHLLENATIGANSTILAGLVVGKNVLVGAGSIITKNLEENKAYYGRPVDLSIEDKKKQQGLESKAKKLEADLC